MNKKIFIDIGAHNGNSLKKAISDFPECDNYIAYEPIEKHYNNLIREFNDKKFVIYPYAIDTCEPGVHKKYFFLDRSHHSLGSTFYKDKKSGKLKMTTVNCVDFSHVFEQFDATDTVYLKLDIEGKEYDFLNYAINQEKFKCVKKLYVEWHQYKIPSISEEIHNSIVDKLIKLKFNITGVSEKDEFYNGL